MRPIVLIIFCSLMAFDWIEAIDRIDLTTIQTCTEYALKNSPIYTAAQAEIDREIDGYKAAQVIPYPLLSGGMFRGASDKFELNVSQDLGFLRHKIDGTQSIDDAAFRAVRLAAERDAFIQRVCAAYIDLAVAQEKMRSKGRIQDLLDVAAELAQRQLDAGNISRLEFIPYKTAQLAGAIQAMSAQQRCVVAIEQLSTLIGVSTMTDLVVPWESFTAWVTSNSSSYVSSANTVSARLEHRDRWAQQFQMHALTTQINATGGGPLELGLHYENDSGDRVGILGSVSVPLWDRAASSPQMIAHAEALFGYHRQVNQLTRSNSEAALVAQFKSVLTQIQTTETELFPLYAELMAESMKHYNYMLKGVYSVLDAQRSYSLAQDDLLDRYQQLAQCRLQLDALYRTGLFEDKGNY